MKRLYSLLSLLVLASLVLAACAPAATATEPPAQTTEQPAEATAAPTEAPTAAPTEPPVTRTGAWVDQVVFTKQDSAEQAVSQLNAGDIDIYAYTVAEAPVYESLKNSPNLPSAQLVPLDLNALIHEVVGLYGAGVEQGQPVSSLLKRKGLEALTKDLLGLLPEQPPRWFSRFVSSPSSPSKSRS